MRRSLTCRAWLVAGLVLGLVVWLGGCDVGGEGGSAARTSTDRSGTLPAPSVTEPDGSVTTPTPPSRSTIAPPTSDAPTTSDVPPTSAEPPTTATNAPTTAPPTSAEAPTTASTAAGTPAAESGGLGSLGWASGLLVVGLSPLAALEVARGLMGRPA